MKKLSHHSLFICIVEEFSILCLYVVRAEFIFNKDCFIQKENHEHRKGWDENEE